MKKNYYWPEMKDKIKEVLGKCERCSVINCKKKGGSDSVLVSRPFEKVVLDMMDTRAERKNILVGIDYFPEELKRLYCRARKQVR